MKDFVKYINDHLVRMINIGKSGADLYELDGNVIAKHALRAKLNAPEIWDGYRNESRFYGAFSSDEYGFIPKLYFADEADDEIQIIIQKYRPLVREAFDAQTLEKVMATLARIHTLPMPDFIVRTKPEPLKMNDAEILRCMRGWREVIAEYGGGFSERILLRIAENINDINKNNFIRRCVLCHGDFHFENLLEDDAGNIIVCDWQGICAGHPAGDISFFLSRLAADGYGCDMRAAIRSYCRFTDDAIAPQEIAAQIRLANLNTSFVFWHEYLHHSSAERVNQIWSKMTADFEYLSDI